jgi:hypothetical protein
MSEILFFTLRKPFLTVKKRVFCALKLMRKQPFFDQL